MRKNEYLALIVMEECAEMQQALSKALRFGYDDHHPQRANETNEEQLLTEFYQLTAMMEELQKQGLLTGFSREKISEIKRDKIKNVYRYLAYSKKQGLVEQ